MRTHSLVLGTSPFGGKVEPHLHDVNDENLAFSREIGLHCLACQMVDSASRHIEPTIGFPHHNLISVSQYTIFFIRFLTERNLPCLITTLHINTSIGLIPSNGTFPFPVV